MTRVLIVDDSALARKLLQDLFASEGDFEVAVARNSEEALEALGRFQPDVITLDVHMPGMDGLACLDRIMLVQPTPVVMVSSLTAAGAEETLEALDLGAVDFIEKPGGALSLHIDDLREHLVQTVRQAASARIPKARRLLDRVRARHGRFAESSPTGQPVVPKPAKEVARFEPGSSGLVLVGASTGGPPALDALLSPLPADFPWPILVAQHMPSSFTGALARRLDGLCALRVVEVAAATLIEPGHVYVARGDADMVVARRADGLAAVPAPADSRYRWHPSAGRLVRSAMEHHAPSALVGVLMTGMGNDGAEAMSDLNARGGYTIAESVETAVVWGMPGDLVRRGGASTVAHLDQIAGALLERLPRP